MGPQWNMPSARRKTARTKVRGIAEWMWVMTDRERMHEQACDACSGVCGVHLLRLARVESVDRAELTMLSVCFFKSQSIYHSQSVLLRCCVGFGLRLKMPI